MVDITFFGLNLMPENIWTLLESIAVAVSLPFLGYELIQTTKATRDQEQATRDQEEEMIESRYQSLREHHHELVMKQIEEPVLMKVYGKLPESEADKKNEFNEKEKKDPNEIVKIFSFYVAEFDLYERVYYWFEQGDIDEYEWACWLIYLEKISRHWLFQYTYEQTRKIFSPGFMEEVYTIIHKNHDAAEYLEHRAENAYENTAKREYLELKMQYEKIKKEHEKKMEDEELKIKYKDIRKKYDEFKNKYDQAEKKGEKKLKLMIPPSFK